MKFGIFFEMTTPRPWDEGSEKRKLDETIEQIVLADRLGIDHAWMTEHHFMEEYCHATAPEVVLSAAAQVTKNIRIGHGVRAIDDKSLIAEIIDRGITLEVCPSSNIAIGVYPSLAEHPLPKLIAAGVNVTLNADDPSFFGADVVEEYQLCAEAFGFTRETLLNITRTAIDAAFCDDATKLALRARLL